MNSRMLHIILIIMAISATISSTDIFLPSLPSMATYFSTTEDLVQLTVPLCLIGSLIGAPCFGILADYLPRKRALLIGLAFFIVGSILCALAPSLSFLLFSRFIQGVGAISAPVIGYAMVQDIYSGDKSAKVMSWMGSIVCVAPLIAPGLGGYIHVQFGWQGNFISLFFVGSLTFILILFFSQFSQRTLKKDKLSIFKTFQTYREILTTRIFIYYISFFSLLSCAEWSYLTSIPFYFENTLGLSPDIFGLYLSGSASFYVLGATVTPIILNRYGSMKTLSFGVFLCLVASLFFIAISLFLPTSPVLIVLTVGIYFFGAAVIWGPSVSRSLQCFEEIRGSASAVRSFLVTFASATGGLAGSLLDDSSIVLLSIFLFLMALGCCWLLVKVQKFEVRKKSSYYV